MKEEFGYKNDMMIPRLEKIVLNMGIGDAVKDTKKVKHAQEALTADCRSKSRSDQGQEIHCGFPGA